MKNEHENEKGIENEMDDDFLKELKVLGEPSTEHGKSIDEGLTAEEIEFAKEMRKKQKNWPLRTTDVNELIERAIEQWRESGGIIPTREECHVIHDGGYPETVVLCQRVVRYEIGDQDELTEEPNLYWIAVRDEESTELATHSLPVPKSAMREAAVVFGNSDEEPIWRHWAGREGLKSNYTVLIGYRSIAEQQRSYEKLRYGTTEEIAEEAARCHAEEITIYRNEENDET